MTEPTEPSSFFAPAEADDQQRTATSAAETSPSPAAGAPAEDLETPPADPEAAAAAPAGYRPPVGGTAGSAPERPATGRQQLPDLPDLGPAPGEPGTAGAVLADLGAGRDVAGFEAPSPTPAPAYEPLATSWSSDRLEAIMRDTVQQQTEEQRRLEDLLADVRGALTAMPSAAEMGGGTQVVAALEQLRAELGSVRESQATAYAQLSARLDALATPAPGAPSITDVHDGLAGVRTDLTALPELLGPAITSAVAHGVAETNRRVGALHETVQSGAAGQSELAPTLAGLSDQVGALHATVHGTHAGTAELAPMLASLSAQVDGLREQVRGTPDLTPTLSGLTDRVEALHETVRGGDVTPRLAGLAEQVSALHETVRAQDDLAPRVSALADQVSAVHDSVRQTSAQAGELAPVVAGLADRVGAVHDTVQSTAAGTGDLAPRLAGLADQVAALHDTVHGSAAQAGELAPLLAGLSDRVGAVHDTVHGGVAQTGDLGPRIADLSAQVDALREAVQGTAGQAGELSPMLAGLTDQVGALHETARGGAAGTAELGPRLDALPAEITHQVSAQVSPLHDTLASLSQQVEPLQATLAALAERVGALEGRDLGPVLDDRLTAHLGAFGTGLGERIDALESQQGAARDDLGALRLANEGPAGVTPTLLAQLHASEQRLAHHVDEAVLALAQAVLRRRPGVPAESGSYDDYEPGGGAAAPLAGEIPAVPAAGPASTDPAPAYDEPSGTGTTATAQASGTAQPESVRPATAADAPGGPAGADASAADDGPAASVTAAAAPDPDAYAQAAYDPPEWGRHAISQSFDETDDGSDELMVDHLDAWSRADPGPGEPAAEHDGPQDVAASELWTSDVRDDFEDDPTGEEPAGADGSARPVPDSLRGVVGMAEDAPKRGLFRRRG